MRKIFGNDECCSPSPNSSWKQEGEAHAGLCLPGLFSISHTSVRTSYVLHSLLNSVSLEHVHHCVRYPPVDVSRPRCPYVALSSSSGQLSYPDVSPGFGALAYRNTCHPNDNTITRTACRFIWSRTQTPNSTFFVLQLVLRLPVSMFKSRVSVPERQDPSASP